MVPDAAQIHSQISVLSPRHHAAAYIAFLLHWVCSLICVAVSLYFFRRGKGAWWTLIALAFFLPLLGNVIQSVRLGVPILPHGMFSDTYQVPAVGGSSVSFRRDVMVRMNWDLLSIVISIALIWGFFQERTSSRQ